MLHTYVIHHRLNEREKMLQLGEGSCFPGLLVGVNVGLAFVDGIIASLAFAQVCFLFIIIINFLFNFFFLGAYILTYFDEKDENFGSGDVLNVGIFKIFFSFWVPGM